MKMPRQEYDFETRVSTKTCLLIASFVVIFVLYRANNQLRYVAVTSENELNKLATNMFYPLPMKQIDFEGFDNNTGTNNGCYLVPNIIHFLKLNENTFTFIEMICILAAYKRQRPELLYIHTNVNMFVGKYWDIIKNIKGLNNVLIIMPVQSPQEIFGTPIKDEWKTFHGSNILRIYILMQFGGIYLNNDIYLIKSLNDFRRYEMTLGWNTGKVMGNHILLAHKDARFLREYLQSYQTGYNPNSLVYNSVVKPTEEILHRKPYLVHRVAERLGTYSKVNNIYMKLWKNWRDYYALRLLINHQYFLQTVLGKFSYPRSFEDYNIVHYPNITFYEMVNDLFDVVKRQVR